MKRRQPLVALACVLLVVTAGCSGLTGPSDGPATDTTTATPTETTTQQPTTTDSPEQLAPGVTTEGVQSALALADAHLDAVRNHSFVKHQRFERANDSGTAFRDTTFQYASESRWRQTATGDGMGVALGLENGTFDRYADGDQVLWQLETGTEQRYGFHSTTAEGQVIPVPGENVFREGTYERSLVYSLASRADSVERREGGGAVLSGTADDFSLTVEPAANAEFTLTVSADGLAESIDLTYEHAGESRDATYERSITFDTSVSDPVEQPDWYATALAETDAAAAELDDLIAPGVTTEGVQDARLLADAHRANVENKTFVMDKQIRQTNESETNYQNTTLSMANQSHWRLTLSGAVFTAGSSQRTDAYADGERVFYRYDNGSAVSYDMPGVEIDGETRAYPPSEVFRVRNYAQLYQRALVYSLASRADEVTEVGNDTVRLTGTANDLTLPVQATNVSFSMTVAADGLVEHLHLTYDHVDEPATFERTITFTTNVTDPVQQPDWYATALNETAANATG
jgi:hypothetical protein